MNNKVYVVTYGCYSGYGIDKIFLDNIKAEEYLKLVKGSAYDDDHRIEEYELEDERFILNTFSKYKILEVLVEFNNDIERIDFCTRVYNNYDYTDFNRRSFYKRVNGYTLYMRFEKPLDFVLTDDVKERYVKIASEEIGILKYHLNSGISLNDIKLIMRY